MWGDPRSGVQDKRVLAHGRKHESRRSRRTLRNINNAFLTRIVLGSIEALGQGFMTNVRSCSHARCVKGVILGSRQLQVKGDEQVQHGSLIERVLDMMAHMLSVLIKDVDKR